MGDMMESQPLTAKQPRRDNASTQHGPMYRVNGEPAEPEDPWTWLYDCIAESAQRTLSSESVETDG